MLVRLRPEVQEMPRPVTARVRVTRRLYLFANCDSSRNHLPTLAIMAQQGETYGHCRRQIEGVKSWQRCGRDTRRAS